MKVRGPINIHAKSQIDRSMHNENLEILVRWPTNSPQPPKLYVWLKGLSFNRLRISTWVLLKGTSSVQLNLEYEFFSTCVCISSSNFIILCIYFTPSDLPADYNLNEVL